jgi:hypothetical protein
VEYGKLCEGMGRKDEAREQYRQALDLTNLIVQHTRRLSRAEVAAVRGRLQALGGAGN